MGGLSLTYGPFTTTILLVGSGIIAVRGASYTQRNLAPTFCNNFEGSLCHLKKKKMLFGVNRNYG